MKAPIVIIGSGLAGFGIARAIRRLDADCGLIMICTDNGANYSKPQLSTALFAKKTASDLVRNSAAEMGNELRMQMIVRTSVTKIDSENSQLSTDKGHTIQYSQLVLATGSSARKLQLKGDSNDALISVNSLKDYHYFQGQLQGKKDILVIGGGLIGCEFSNDLLTSGHQVKLVEPCARLINVLVPPQVSLRLEQAFEKNGAQLHLGRCAKAVNKVDGGYRVTLDNGESLNCELVVSAVGVVSNIDIAKESGLKVNRGIVVNRHLQTSVENIYAIGDCCELEGRVLPYVAPILAGCKALAATLTGSPTEVIYPAMPISIKTSIFPVAAAPVPLGADGSWSVEEDSDGIKATFEKSNGELLGMALGGNAIKFRGPLSKQLPPVMPACTATCINKSADN